MSRRYSGMWRVLTVSPVLPDIGEPHGSVAPKCRCKYIGIPRHGKVSKRLFRHSGQGIEEILLPCFIQVVIEKCPKFSLAQLPACIGDRLYELLQVKLGGQGCAHPVEDTLFLFALSQCLHGVLALCYVLNGDERLTAPVQTARFQR